MKRPDVIIPGVLRSGASRQPPVKAAMVIDLRAQSTTEFGGVADEMASPLNKTNYEELQTCTTFGITHNLLTDKPFWRAARRA
jgi:hypothetical protein